LEFEGSAAQFIDVLAGDSLQRLRVDLPLDTYRSALQKLGR
jgi:hypothetical protein